MCIPSVQFVPLIIDVSFNIHIHLCILSVPFFLKITFFMSKFIYVFHYCNVFLIDNICLNIHITLYFVIVILRVLFIMRIYSISQKCAFRFLGKIAIFQIILSKRKFDIEFNIIQKS